MNRVILSPEYFPNPTIGRPVSGAQIFVGLVDLDPEIEANQKQISVQQEDGSIVEVSQPVICGAGGVPLHIGSPVTILVNGEYALKVLDKGGSQIYYIPEQLLSTADSEAITYNPPFTDAEPRTQEDKNADIFSVKDFGAVGDGITNDDTAIAAAVAYVKLNAGELFWPEGRYETTTSIPDLHSVPHVGTGAIKRGGNTFFVNPNADEASTLYVSTTGLSTNDGLSVTQPMLLIQDAFDALVNYGPVLDGTWTILPAAGTYTTFGSGTRIAELQSGLLSLNPIVLAGPTVGHPNEPTVLLGPSGTSRVSGNGIFITNGSKLFVKNIKAQNFNGIGFSADTQCQLKTENAHAFNCGTYGISAISLCDLVVQGGIIDGFDTTSTGIRSLFVCRHSIGDQVGADIANGPVVQNCEVGFLAQEGSTGHSDYVEYISNTFATKVTVNARVNATGSDFKLNTVALRAELGGVILDTDVVLNTDTGNANTDNYRTKSGGTQAVKSIYNTWSVADLDFITFTTAAVTSDQNAKTFVMEAGRWTSVPGPIYQGKAIKLKVSGNITGTAGVKEFRMRIATLLLTGVTVDADAAGFFTFEGTVFLSGSAAQKTIMSFTAQDGVQRTEIGYSTTTINTASAIDQDLTFDIQLANAADSVDVEIFEVEVQG